MQFPASISAELLNGTIVYRLQFVLRCTSGISLCIVQKDIEPGIACLLCVGSVVLLLSDFIGKFLHLENHGRKHSSRSKDDQKRLHDAQKARLWGCI